MATGSYICHVRILNYALKLCDLTIIGCGCIKIDKSYYANANKGLLIIHIITGLRLQKQLFGYGRR